MLTREQLDAIDEASAHRHAIHNGSGLTLDRGTMESILSLARRTLEAEADAAVAVLREVEKDLMDITCDGCEYGDNCPPDARHYECRTCQLTRLADRLAVALAAGKGG